MGDDRFDVLAAMVAAAVTRALHPKSRIDVPDFMPKWGGGGGGTLTDPEAMAAALNAISRPAE